MPWTLSRYIALRFAVMISAMFLLCMIIIFMADFVELVRISTKRGSLDMGTILSIAILRLPSFGEMVMPFSALAGSIGAFLMLSRGSELVIMRAGGMSVWRFALPGLLVALVFGIAAVTLYNPMAAQARAEADRRLSQLSGETLAVLSREGAGAWLRQDGTDGQTIVHASVVADKGRSLGGVIVLQYGRDGRFVERIDAKGAKLDDSRWILTDVWVAREREPAQRYDTYVTSTYLSPTEVEDAIASLESISFWELPAFIAFAEKAGLPATRHKVRYYNLLARPLLLVAMVLVAATCAVRAFRFGNVQRNVILGLATGIGVFLFSEMSRRLGVAGMTTPVISAWGPPLIACLTAATMLLHREDG